MAIVKEILDPAIKTGQGAKGQWTQALIKLDNGTETRIFQPISVGDEVESYQNGDYTNWKLKVAPKTAKADSDDASLRYIYRKLIEMDKKLDKLLDGDVTEDELDNLTADDPMPPDFLKEDD